jgi:hypothetical protein
MKKIFEENPETAPNGSSRRLRQPNRGHLDSQSSRNNDVDGCFERRLSSSIAARARRD